MILYSPFEKLRPSQEELAQFIAESIENKKNCIVHAPTGLGKTAAALAATIPIAEKEDCKILFLTSRHTQHEIVRETAQMIRNKHSPKLSCTSIYGKKHLCAHDGASLMNSNDFSSYCKNLRSDGVCEFFTQTKNKHPKHIILMEEVLKMPAPKPEEILEKSKNCGSCPYEVLGEHAKNSRIIIADYSQIFHPTMRESLLKRIGTQMEKIIVIIDEAHNLPKRLRELSSCFISTITIKRAIKEAKNFQPSAITRITEIQNCMNNLTTGMIIGEEKIINKNSFKNSFSIPLEEIVDELEELAERVRKEKHSSSAGSISEFLKMWSVSTEESFARIIGTESTFGGITTRISLESLDPSRLFKNAENSLRGILLMSGTLTPIQFYKDILGLDGETQAKTFPSPFPKENRMVIIIPKTTTKFTQRNQAQYENISKECEKIIQKIPGNAALFFPSYYLMDSIRTFLNTDEKKNFVEQKGLTPEERSNILKEFREQKRGILFGVSNGSFGEGIDLPGVLDSVIIVGLPLEKPDLRTQEMINYYDRKYAKGWQYGYTLPALTRIFQNAGRCIRSEKDRGTLIFLDERFTQRQYFDAFPEDWKINITQNPEKILEEFFGKN
ncbi:ATP-dependent DNA helicase [Candidatus Woesearchaeota archaeon]|nr:ATP-dependent DNA helicase [Candidatus Woesearchaeota archaeon]